MYNDKQLVRITVMILLIGIVLVYAVFFNLKGEELKGGAVQAVQHFFDPSSSEQVSYSSGDRIMNNETSGNVLADTGNTVSFSGLEQLFGSSSEYLGTGRRIFSGTALYQGSIDILNILGINHEYVLKDSAYPSLFYVYIGRDTSYNLRQIAKEFG